MASYRTRLLAEAGVDSAIIKNLGRWGSSAVERCIGEGWAGGTQAVASKVSRHPVVPSEELSQEDRNGLDLLGKVAATQLDQRDIVHRRKELETRFDCEFGSHYVLNNLT